ncbi:MAG TPA: hypothetical protein VJK08_03110 [Patescibacteria group bacterium]|nr:hypothetical protein [Patescibacteria group bacterium]
MLYIERTLHVKTALLERPDLQETIRAIFASHITNDGACTPIGEGSSRKVYKIGWCEIAAGAEIVLLLKLKKRPSGMKYSHAAERSQYSELSEFGAFEMYYDFTAGHISAVSFRTKAGFERYRAASVINWVKFTFSLSENWGGTRVAQGDMDAIPYFMMAVRYQHLFGQLTEGEPPLIVPKHTTSYTGTMEDHTIEGGRIIDLDPTECLLIDIDRGGYLGWNERYPSNLGVRHRGQKYFSPAHRLDL